MKQSFIRKVFSICLVLCMMFSSTSPVFAESVSNSDGTAKIEDLENGKMYIQETEEKLIAIGADHTTHTVTISIKYATDTDRVYQWIFNDYPMEESDLDDVSFWENVISYAEGRIGEATIVTFTTEELNANDPMPIGATGAYLNAEMESVHGAEHTDKQMASRVINGKLFLMYENLWFLNSEAGTKSWTSAITLASLVVGVLGKIATNSIMKAICKILGKVFEGANMLIEAGKLKEYKCTANYHRYVRFDSGLKYSLSDKIVSYTAYENTDLNDTSLPTIVWDTKTEEYGISEEHFNGGMFDEAYNNYILGITS